MDFPISVPGVGLQSGLFVDEDPASGQIGSLIPSAWANGLTTEVLNVIRAAGLAPKESQHDQLQQAITALITGGVEEAGQLVDEGMEEIRAKLVEFQPNLLNHAVVAGGNNSPQLQKAISAANGRRIYGPKGPFNAAVLDDALGADFDDSVRITVAGKLYNTYAHRQLVWGSEHLYGVYNKLMARTGLKIVFTGDSTTQGAGVTNPNNQIPNLIANGAKKDGFYQVTAINRGQFGKMASEWDTTYVAEDIAQNADLYVVRWGLNDPYNGRTLTQYAASLRSGLAKLRAAKPLSSGVGIVLMTPNSTDDASGAIARNALWHEEVVKIHRRAARDFNCAFIDSYGLFQNSQDAGGLWMDSIKVHPKDVYNLLLGSVIYDLIFPSLVRLNCKKTELTPLPLVSGWVNHGGENQGAAMYYKDADNRVHLSGVIKGGTTTSFSTLANLPADCRPAASQFFAVVSSGGVASLNVTVAGQVGVFSLTDNTLLCLNGISFLAA